MAAKDGTIVVLITRQHRIASANNSRGLPFVGCGLSRPTVSLHFRAFGVVAGLVPIQGKEKV